MPPMQWQRIEDLFELAHAQPIKVRRRFLAEACGGDVSLRDEVEAMLAAAIQRRERFWGIFSELHSWPPRSAISRSAPCDTMP